MSRGPQLVDVGASGGTGIVFAAKEFDMTNQAAQDASAEYDIITRSFTVRSMRSHVVSRRDSITLRGPFRIQTKLRL